MLADLVDNIDDPFPFKVENGMGLLALPGTVSAIISTKIQIIYSLFCFLEVYQGCYRYPEIADYLDHSMGSNHLHDATFCMAQCQSVGSSAAGTYGWQCFCGSQV